MRKFIPNPTELIRESDEILERALMRSQVANENFGTAGNMFRVEEVEPNAGNRKGAPPFKNTHPR